MSYDKQTWNKYDELKTEEENIENGAVVTDNRMNHMETGIGDNDANLASHLADKNNPHKVTAAQVGLGNVQNFGLATEDEAKQGISNAKYMTPSLTQAVLSANINSIAYANSADGTDGFTNVYPNLNLLDGTKDFSGNWYNTTPWYKNGNYEGLTVMSFNTGDNIGIVKPFNIPSNGIYSMSMLVKVKTDSIGQFIIEATGKPSIVIDVTDTGGKFVTQSYTGTFTTGQTVSMYFRFKSNEMAIKDGLSVAGHKIEQCSVSTPYMPSSSEVTTADRPKYIGFSNTVKINKSASDYTWFPVKDSELTNKVDSHVNNKSNPHSVTASQVGAYTKTESDSKLTDLSNKVIANKGNLASGTDLDNVIDIGTYRIGGLTGGTDIINVPSERSGTTIYAYLTVSGTTTSVVQELIVYDSKTVSQIYSRSRSGSTPTFSPWSKTVMADDSGKVTVQTLSVQGAEIYPNSKEGAWTVERLSDTEYRLTQIMTFSIAITGAVGQMFASQPITYPSLPSGYTLTNILPDVIATANWCWAIVDTNSQYRLATFASTANGSRTVRITAYATKAN
ncbi:pyocin knob domain-containing protein [Lactococcus lactis subsp. lactis]|uniref:pyocin knob domain-containing protein n=1 Tax=Lactococcus lactis TaxID=1358 RepID=UPI003748A380